MFLRKAILVFLSVAMSFSQSYAINTTSLVTGIAIGTATDNMALGLALAVTLDSDRPASVSHTYELDSPLSDGRKYIELREATHIYRGLFGLDSNLRAEQAELLKRYSSSSDKNTILRSLVTADNLVVESQANFEKREFVKSIKEISQLNKMSNNLIEKAKSYGLEVKDSALKNVMEVQKAIGMHVAIERIEAESGANYKSAKEAIARWTAVELLDLRFDIADSTTDRAPADKELANRVRIEFALNVIESTFEVLGSKVQNVSQRMFQEFEAGGVYEEYKRKRIQTESSKQAWITAGIIIGILVGAGAPVVDLMMAGNQTDPILFRITDALAPKGHTAWIALAEFGIFTTVLFSEISAGFAAGFSVVKAVEKAVKSLRSKIIRGELHSTFESSHPMREALRLFLNSNRPKLCRLVI